jgi:hypothetical protein
MNMRQSRKITLITPAHAGDLDRFRFQRESIERLDICETIKHLALVDHEDMPAFKDVGFDRNLELVSTRDLLPRKLEARRRAAPRRRRDIRRYLQPRPLHGWMVQQLLKLAATQIVDTEGVVSMDCDTFFVRPIEHSDYFADDGRMLLFEEDVKPPAEFIDWVISVMKFLGVRLNKAPVNVYTFSAVPLHCGVLEDMKRHIEQRHKRPWLDAIVAGNVFEYSLHGVYARFIDEFARQTPVAPTLTLHYWDLAAMEDFDQKLSADLAISTAKAAMVQGNMGLKPDDYRAAVEHVWRDETDAAAARG